MVLGGRQEAPSLCCLAELRQQPCVLILLLSSGHEEAQVTGHPPWLRTELMLLTSLSSSQAGVTLWSSAQIPGCGFYRSSLIEHSHSPLQVTNNCSYFPVPEVSGGTQASNLSRAGTVQNKTTRLLVPKILTQARLYPCTGSHPWSHLPSLIIWCISENFLHL